MAGHHYAPLDVGYESKSTSYGSRKNWAWTVIAVLGCLTLAYQLFRPATEDEIRIECRRKIGPRKVHVVLPATDTSPRFCRSISTMLIHDYEPVIVNWGGESHHSAKIFKLLEYLEKNTSAPLEKELELPVECREERGDIVLSLDAYDVLTQRPMESVIAEFDKIPANIAYSAEKGCHPPGEDWCSQVPSGPLPLNLYGPQTDDDSNLPTCRARFLNSGFVIGYAKDLHSLYSDAAAQATEREGQFTYDQSIFGPLYTSGDYNMTLDFYGAMATPTFFFDDELGFEPTPTSLQKPDPRFITDEIMWHQFNHVTHQFPTFVHYNGFKGWMDDAWKKMYWGGGQGTRVMERINEYLSNNVSIALESGERIPFREMCPGSWQIP